MDKDPENNGVPESNTTSTAPPFVRSVLAVLFVAGLGVALAIPLIRGSDTTSGSRPPHHGRAKSSRPAATATVSSTPTPVPSFSNEMPHVTFGFSPNRYPKACERPARPPSGTGQIVSFERGKSGAGMTTVADVDGTVLTRFVSDATLRWSASGKWLLSSAGHLWTSTGEDRGFLFPGGSGLATWSPSSDCAFAVSANRTKLFVARPGHDAVELANGDLQAFAISPDGSHLAVATSFDSDKQQVFIDSLNLIDHSESSYEDNEGTCCVVFASSWLDHSTPLLWILPGMSVGADGWPLEALSNTGHGRAKPVTVADPIIPAGNGYAARCGDSLIAVVGRGRPYPTLSHKRLAIVSPERTPRYLTPQGVVYQWPSCSSDGNYAAAIAMPEGSTGDDGHLTIVSTSGGVVQTLTSGSDLGDFNPDWGPLGTGVLFGRASAAGKPWTLWYAPEGGTPRSTSIRTSAYAYDWSATRPTGLP